MLRYLDVRLLVSATTIAAIFASSSEACRAQPRNDGTVTGMGAARIEQPPALLRMRIQLAEQGASVKEALARLKERREGAIAQLESLGAEKDSIKSSDADLQAVESPEQAQYAQVRQRSGPRSRGSKSGQKRAESKAPPVKVKVVSTLSAEWKLTFENHEALLELSHQLTTKIEAADLAGLKEPKEMTPEEAELAEEMAEEMAESIRYSSSNGRLPGMPAFSYVARITEEQQDRAMSEAFAKARQHAEKLAKAAGVQLGKLQSVRMTESPREAMEYYEAFDIESVLQGENSAADGNALEAVSSAPGPVTRDVVIGASFELIEK